VVGLHDFLLRNDLDASLNLCLESVVVVLPGIDIRQAWWAIESGKVDEYATRNVYGVLDLKGGNLVGG